MTGLALPTDTPKRAPHLLMALLDSAIKLGAVKTSKPQSGAFVESEQQFGRDQKLMVEALSILCKEAESYRATQRKPTTASEALDAMIAAQEMYVQASADYIDKLFIWRRADDQTSRVRASAASTFEGLSPTAQDKAASSHPQYTEHKDYCTGLAEEKDAAEIEMKVAESNVRNARDIFRAITSEGGLSLIDPSTR